MFLINSGESRGETWIVPCNGDQDLQDIHKENQHCLIRFRITGKQNKGLANFRCQRQVFTALGNAEDPD